MGNVFCVYFLDLSLYRLLFPLTGFALVLSGILFSIFFWTLVHNIFSVFDGMVLKSLKTHQNVIILLPCHSETSSDSV
jgi:hypothetical protein